MIEELSRDLIEDTVTLHIECFKDSFLSSLDRGVLTCMYKNYVSTELGQAYIYVENNQIIGVIAGTINPSVYYNQLIKKRGASLIWLTLKRACKNPKILLSIARRNLSGFFRPDESEEAYQKASLDVIGVMEDYRGTGVAEQLAEAFLNSLKARGVLEVNLGVSPDNMRARKFYEKIGLQHLRTHEDVDGRESLIYGMKFGESI